MHDGGVPECDAIAERAERGTHRPMPDLREPLASLTALAQDTRPRVESRVARHVQGRLALYSELVPRIERLGTDLADAA